MLSYHHKLQDLRNAEYSADAELLLGPKLLLLWKHGNISQVIPIRSNLNPPILTLGILPPSPPRVSDCAVCSEGYGRGVANACHKCTASIKNGMYFILAVSGLLTLIVGVLLAVYLVSGASAWVSRADGRYLNRLIILYMSC